MLATTECATMDTATKIVSAVVALMPTRNPARHDRVTVWEAMIAFTGPGGREREADAGAGEDRPEDLQDHAEAIAAILMKGARQILYRPVGSCGRAHRRIDVQSRAVPETSRRAAGVRIRLRGARPDVAHVGANEVGGGGGGPREAPSPVHRSPPAIAFPPGGPRPVRRLHRRARAGGDPCLQRTFHGGAVRAANLTGDEHLPFGKGTIDLERDARALKARGYEGPVTLEIFKGIPDDRRACLRKMRRWTKE